MRRSGSLDRRKPQKHCRRELSNSRFLRPNESEVGSKRLRKNRFQIGWDYKILLAALTVSIFHSASLVAAARFFAACQLRAVFGYLASQVQRIAFGGVCFPRDFRDLGRDQGVQILRARNSAKSRQCQFSFSGPSPFFAEAKGNAVRAQRSWKPFLG